MRTTYCGGAMEDSGNIAPDSGSKDIEITMDEGSCALDTAELVRRHYALVYRYAYRLCGSAVDAEDLTQQAFLAAQEKLDQLREPECAKGWLCTIARHVYLKGFRGRG